jgi:hypothetical protein
MEKLKWWWTILATQLGFAGGMPGGQTKVVDSVDEMLANKQGVTDINQVTIDAVPDFSGVMGKLKESGKL